jgi:hypothetical protein
MAVGTTVIMVVAAVVCTVMAGIAATGSAAGLLAHPARRSRNTRAATAKTDAGDFPAVCTLLFIGPFFIKIPF